MNPKVGSQVMITSNIDINDRLDNGLVGRVTQFKYSNVVSVVYVKINDKKCKIRGNEVRCNSSTVSLGINKEALSIAWSS